MSSKGQCLRKQSRGDCSRQWFSTRAIRLLAGAGQCPETIPVITTKAGGTNSRERRHHQNSKSNASSQDFTSGALRWQKAPGAAEVWSLENSPAISLLNGFRTRLALARKQVKLQSRGAVAGSDAQSSLANADTRCPQKGSG